MFPVILIRWIVVYPVDTAIQRLKSGGQGSKPPASHIFHSQLLPLFSRCVITSAFYPFQNFQNLANNYWLALYCCPPKIAYDSFFIIYYFFKQWHMISYSVCFILNDIIFSSVRLQCGPRIQDRLLTSSGLTEIQAIGLYSERTTRSCLDKASITFSKFVVKHCVVTDQATLARDFTQVRSSSFASVVV